MNNQQPQPLTPRDAAQQKYAAARGNLLLMIMFTAINIILLFVNSDTMFLFSATVPYFSALFGQLSESTVMYTTGMVIAAVSIIIYLLCWIFSKKHYGWLIASLVFFIIDTLCMVGLYFWAEDFSGVIDLLIHIWVLYYLIMGVKWGIQLRKLPQEEGNEELYYTNNDDEVNPYTETENPHPIRRAEEDVKSRVLLECEYEGHHISYRRVKRVNELVIDNHVYDEIEMLIETAHTLEADIDGHNIQAGYDGKLFSFINVDGTRIAKKIRLF